MQAIKPLIISPTILGASREIQCVLQIRTFGDGEVFERLFRLGAAASKTYLLARALSLDG